MRASRLTLALALASPLAAQAHSFGRVYTLPVPYWMYIYGAVAALVLSFVVVAYFASVAPATAAPREYLFGDAGWLQALRRWRIPTALRLLVLGLFVLCVATGLLGSRDPYRNFNMTFIWIVFALGLGYLTALTGNLYALVNPWRTLGGGLTRLLPQLERGLWSYPHWLGYWPALAFYMAFIAVELFAHVRPVTVAHGLLIYTALTLTGMFAFGIRPWLRQAELFSVFFRLIALMAPVDYRPQERGAARWRLRWPFAGLAHERCEHISLLVFLLFMLSSTAFDGLRETAVWFALFWKDPYDILTPLLGEPPLYAYLKLRPWYLAYEMAWLLLSPLLYLGLFMLFVWLGRLLVGSRRATRELALEFGFSLLPIALVYNITHYSTLVLSQGVKIVALASDPFGWGWDLFGTALTMRAPILPDMIKVWHAQVALILLGHVISVAVAHVVALRLLRDRWKAALNQLPMLALMVLFTGFGLWILAQPLQG